MQRNDMTRHEQCLLIDALASMNDAASKALKEEISYQMYDVEEDREGSEGAYDEVDALDDILDKAYGAVLRRCREVAIQLGWYRHVTEEELQNTVCTGKPYDFKLEGKKYAWTGVAA